MIFKKKRKNIEEDFMFLEGNIYRNKKNNKLYYKDNDRFIEFKQFISGYNYNYYCYEDFEDKKNFTNYFLKYNYKLFKEIAEVWTEWQKEKKVMEKNKEKRINKRIKLL